MKRTILFLLSLSLLVGVGFGLFEWNKENIVNAAGNANENHPLALINQKAKKARTGNQEDAKELVGEIIHVSGITNEFDGFSSDSITDRVGRNESRYQLGQADSIPEGKIVRTINGLAKQLNLPNYARTNSYEVRKLRLSLLPNFPQLINQKTQSSQSLTKGMKFDSQMSPAESILVLTMMIQQKMNNQEYQLTNSERLSSWNDAHSHNPKKPKKDKAQNSSSSRSMEMRRTLENGADSMSISDALRLSDITLNTLGIEQ